MKRAEEETAGCFYREKYKRRCQQTRMNLPEELIETDETYSAGLEGWERRSKGIGSSQEKSNGEKTEHGAAFVFVWKANDLVN